MAEDLPYMPSVGNVPSILTKIRQAGTPPKFTAEFVKTLGFTASQDRSFPRILKQLKFISPDGAPLPRYNEFKATGTGGRALAEGLREGWAPIFMANQNANELQPGELTDIFKSVTGESESVARKMASTFKAFAKEADWSAAEEHVADEVEDNPRQGDPQERVSAPAAEDSRGINLHHDIHLHLPPTSDVAVYRAIFRALRDELQ